MAKQITLFEYSKSRRIVTWGHHFDSLTELKFAISIRDDYEFLRAPVAIYYHPGTKQPVDHIRCCDRRYTPDFLIRHKQTCEAFLVEIKPRVFEYHPQLVLRKEVAENYIHRKKYDWRFKVVYDDEIILDQEQLEDFTVCCGLKTRSALAAWFTEYTNRLEQMIPNASRQLRGDKKISFVMFGTHAEK